jgi:hypothetical protein
MDLIAPMVAAGIVLHLFHTAGRKEGRKEVWTPDVVDTSGTCIITSVEVAISMIFRQIDHPEFMMMICRKIID